ncbi:roadblock/LC7 domain-containing protein [Dactylosporangium darangshiense]|uniref:Roadblock/LC7 domain-containing protein n=1 Tax=Dactylosporangium darangshiense TaxID=579108 RepID=A0ABP8DV78_9ACTN
MTQPRHEVEKGTIVGQEPSTAVDLTWLVQDLVDRVAYLRHAVVLSADGLAIAASKTIQRDDAERLSAVASGLQSLARGVGTHFEIGDLRQTVLEFEDGYVFVIGAGHGTCLAVISGPDTDLGLVAYEMGMLVKRVAEHLATRPRHYSGQINGG